MYAFLLNEYFVVSSHRSVPIMHAQDMLNYAPHGGTELFSIYLIFPIAHYTESTRYNYKSITRTLTIIKYCSRTSQQPDNGLVIYKIGGVGILILEERLHGPTRISNNNISKGLFHSVWLLWRVQGV